jgi:hypothetical protein
LIKLNWKGHDAAFYRVVKAAPHVRRAESGGQRSEGDSRRYHLGETRARTIADRTERTPMTNVAWELALVGARLSEEDSNRFIEVERLLQIIQTRGGEAVGVWEYHFATLEAAQGAASDLRQMSLAFDDIRIGGPLEARIGNDLAS